MNWICSLYVVGIHARCFICVVHWTAHGFKYNASTHYSLALHSRHSFNWNENIKLTAWRAPWTEKKKKIIFVVYLFLFISHFPLFFTLNPMSDRECYDSSCFGCCHFQLMVFLSSSSLLHTLPQLLYAVFCFVILLTDWLNERSSPFIKSEQMRRVKRFPQWNQYINKQAQLPCLWSLVMCEREWEGGIEHRVLSIHIKISYFLASVLSSSVDLFQLQIIRFLCVFLFWFDSKWIIKFHYDHR